MYIFYTGNLLTEFQKNKNKISNKKKTIQNKQKMDPLRKKDQKIYKI